MVAVASAQPLQRLQHASERLDELGVGAAELPGALADLARINALLFGTRLTSRCLNDLLETHPPDAPLTLLDVGCGGGELTAAVARRARRSGRPVTAIAIDRNPAVVAHARRRFGDQLDLRLGDILALDLPEDEVDVALCSLLVHHLEPDDAVRALRELARVARIGIVVNDLVRSKLGLVGSRTLIPLLTRNPVTRHDAVLSVRRAYTPRELRELLVAAGLRPLSMRGALGYRVAVAAVQA